MAFPDRLLAGDEQVVIHKHPHWKVLAIPTLAFIVILAAVSFMTAWISKWDDVGFTTHRWWFAVVGVLGGLLLVLLCLIPLLRWQSEHFVLTTRHIYFRTGIVHRYQHQIPLRRVEHVETAVSFAGRILRYGSLIIDSGSDDPLEFSTIGSISRVHSTLNRLVSEVGGGEVGGGTVGGGIGGGGTGGGVGRDGTMDGSAGRGGANDEYNEYGRYDEGQANASRTEDSAR